MSEIITISAFVKNKYNKKGIELPQPYIGQVAEVRIKNGRIINDKKITPIKIEVIGWDYTQWDKCLKVTVYINLRLKCL